MKNQVTKKLTGSAQKGKVKSVLPPVAARFRKHSLQQQTEEAFKNVTKITNETIAEHREEVLRGARKFKYPLEHSKHKIILISSALFVLAVAVFFAFTSIGLYRIQSTSRTMYRITQVIPFPIAKVGKRYVSYENYLFEIRSYMHYYQTQKQVDFGDKSGKQQLDSYKPQALEKVMEYAYIKQLAEKHKVSVSSGEVQDALSVLRTQNRLSGNKELASVIRRFYDWSIDDLERELRQELLAQKVAAKLDTEADQKAKTVLEQIRGGADFASLAGQYSDDSATKGNGGQYNDNAINMDSQEVSPVIVRELPKMKEGEVSNIITTPTSFEIVKLLGVDGNNNFKAAHIQIKFKSIDEATKDMGKKVETKKFIKLENRTVDSAK